MQSVAVGMQRELYSCRMQPLRKIEGRGSKRRTFPRSCRPVRRPIYSPSADLQWMGYLAQERFYQCGQPGWPPRKLARRDRTEELADRCMAGVAREALPDSPAEMTPPTSSREK